MKKIVALVFGCVAFTALSASAATLNLTGGTANVPLPANWNDLIAGGPDVGSLVTTFSHSQALGGAGVSLSANSKLQYTYLGKEAGNTNTSNLFGSMFNTSVTPVGTSVIVNGLAGNLDFTFWTNSSYSGGIPGSFTNGVGASFTSLSMAVYVESGKSLILMFNDGRSDKDYDDMMVRVSTVPLPAAFWLFGSGLVGIAGLRKRAKNA